MNAIRSEGGPRLEWPILVRFTEYVRRMIDGRIVLEGGAGEPADGVFAFPLVQAVNVDAETNYAFDGTVRFTGHGGMLNLPLGGFEIRVSKSGDCQVTIADPDEPHVRLLFATATATHEPDSIGLIPSLTEDGSELYFYRYPAGFTLEPAHVLFTRPSDGDGSDAHHERSANELG